jgi:hypothetical protein
MALLDGPVVDQVRQLIAQGACLWPPRAVRRARVIARAEREPGSMRWSGHAGRLNVSANHQSLANRSLDSTVTQLFGKLTRQMAASILRAMSYRAEYLQLPDDSGNAGWMYRIFRNDTLIFVSPHHSRYPTLLDAEMMAEEVIMRLEEDEEEAESS